MLHFTCPLKTVDRVAISPDGNFLAAAGGSNRHLFVWDTRHPETILHQFDAAFENHLWHFQFEPTENTLVVGNRFGITGYDPQVMAEVWEIPTENEYDYVIQGFDLSADGTELVYATDDIIGLYSQYERWEWKDSGNASRKNTSYSANENICQSLAWIPNSGYYVTAEQYDIEPLEDDILAVTQSRIDLRVVEKRTTKFTLETNQKKINQLKVSRDGQFIAAQFQKVICVWQTASLKAKGENLRDEIRLRNKFSFTGIAFHPSGRYLAASRSDGRVILYDTTSWQHVQTYDWNIGPLRSIAFNTSGELAVAGGTDGRIVVWDMDE